MSNEEPIIHDTQDVNTEQKSPPLNSIKKPEEKEKLLGVLIGSIGLVAIFSTIFTYILTQEFSSLIYWKLVLGILAELYYFSTNRDSLKKFFHTQSSHFTILTLIMVLIFIGILFAINYIASKHPVEIDLTKNKIHSLSDQTSKVLKKINQEITITGIYYREEPDRDALAQIVKRYQKHTQKLSLNLINPSKNPTIVEKYQISEYGPRVIVQAGKKEIKLKNVTEQDLTNALVKVTQTSSKTIYFLTGHGEHDITSDAADGYSLVKKSLEDEGYEVKTFSLFENEEIPSTAVAFIISAPKGKLFEPEIKAVEAFIKKGGKLLFMTEPGAETGLEPIFENYNITLGQNMVVDPNPVSRFLGMGPAMPLVHQFESHQITQGIQQAVVFPTVRSISINDTSKTDAQYETVVKTGEASWAEKQYQNEEVTQDADDIAGPVSIAVAVTSNNYGDNKTNLRLLIFGDSDFASNQYVQTVSNMDFFLNSVNWTASEEDRISIRPKTRGNSMIHLTEAQANFIKFFSIDIIPMSILAVGVAIWQVRRRR